MKPWLIPLQQQISQQLSAGILPHALLITGVSHSGKQQLAQWLIDVFICQSPTFSPPDQAHGVYQPCQHCKACLLNQGGTYPDHLALAAEKSTIGVDNIRNVSAFFEKTAQIGQVKSALIKQAELMTVSASNALLKTLEEPTANSFIILLTTKAEKLLPTIISRCQCIDIRPPIGEQLVTGSNTSGVDQFSNISQLPELLDADIAADFIQLKQAFSAYILGSGDSVALLPLLANQSEAFRWLEKILCDQIRAYNGWKEADVAVEQISQVSLFAIYQHVLATHQLLITLPQANRGMMLEKLLVDIAMIRTADHDTKNN